MAHSNNAADFQKTVKQHAQPPLLLIGPWQQQEFAKTSNLVFLEQEPPHAANIDEACRILGDSPEPPELIFLAQLHPGSYSQTDIDQLQQLAPLARFVIVSGTWCEGELRTGTPLAGTIRLYWYELAPWWEIALHRYQHNLCPLWSLPLDSPQAGRWATIETKAATLPPVLIHSYGYTSYEAIAAALKQIGISSHWNNHTAPATTTPICKAGIWNGGQLSPQELEHLTKFCQQVSGRVIALLDFPRAEHLEQAQVAGAASVLAKPYIVEEILFSLQLTTSIKIA